MLVKAFAVGGVICVVGQLLIDHTKLTPARILVLFVVAGVVLSAVGLYQPLVDFAKALEKACIDTVEAGQVTGDLAALIGPSAVKLTSLQFLRAIRARVEAAIA
jgi:hypothetical protein